MGAGLASVLCSSILTSLPSLRPFSDSDLTLSNLSPFSVSDFPFNFSHCHFFFNSVPSLSTWFSLQHNGCFVPSSLFPVSCFTLKVFDTASQPGELGHTNIGIALEFCLLMSCSLDVWMFVHQRRGQWWEQVTLGAGALVDWPPKPKAGAANLEQAGPQLWTHTFFLL